MDGQEARIRFLHVEKYIASLLRLVFYSTAAAFEQGVKFRQKVSAKSREKFYEVLEKCDSIEDSDYSPDFS